jgi:serine/threonine protein kinase
MSEDWNANTLVGARLGSCVLERVLGAGGMGAVYLARQVRPHRAVAVKVLCTDPDLDPRAWAVFLARFRREADATAALDHANIIPIYEFGDARDAPYLVMPYLPDGSLDALIARDGPLPLDRAIAYLAQAAAALDYAHAHGIVHRDVKPSNLLLHTDGRLLLADFGIAHLIDRPDLAHPSAASPMAAASAGGELTVAGLTLGTPEYMAPEQVLGGPVGPATDIYALGALAFTLLTGTTRTASDPPLLDWRTPVDPAGQLQARRPDLPPGVGAALRWALEEDPAERPASGLALLRALRESRQSRASRTAFGAPDPRHSSAAPFRAPGSGTLSPGGGLGFAGPGPRGDSEHDAPTIGGLFGRAAPARGYGGPVGLGGPGGPGNAPVWPGGGEPPRDRGGRRGRLGCGAVAAGIGGLLVLCLAMGALALALAPHGGTLAGLDPRPTATAQPSPTVTPTPTPMPTATATPVVNWLTVRPESISLGCGTKSKSVRVTLRNLGPERVWWWAAVPFFGGVSVSPLLGQLASGGRVTVTVTNTSSFSGHQGTIPFTANIQQAGQPAQLGYQTLPC